MGSRRDMVLFRLRRRHELTFTLIQQLPIPLAPRLQLGILMPPSSIPLLCTLKFGDIKPHTPTSFIGKAILHDLLRECHNFGHVFRDTSDAVGGDDA